MKRWTLVEWKFSFCVEIPIHIFLAHSSHIKSDISSRHHMYTDERFSDLNRDAIHKHLASLSYFVVCFLSRCSSFSISFTQHSLQIIFVHLFPLYAWIPFICLLRVYAFEFRYVHMCIILWTNEHAHKNNEIPTRNTHGALVRSRNQWNRIFLVLK